MYQVNFIDGVFNGDNPECSKWNLIPNKPIQSLTYKILGKTLYLEGFKAYNHLVEHTSFFNGRGTLITKVILLAKTDTEIKRVCFDLQQKSIYNLKDSRYDSATGWKIGLSTNQPKILIK